MKSYPGIVPLTLDEYLQDTKDYLDSLQKIAIKNDGKERIFLKLENNGNSNQSIGIFGGNTNEIYGENIISDEYVKSNINIPVGSNPAGIMYNPANNYLYVVNESDATVSVIDSNTNIVIKTITGISGNQLVYNPKNSNIYVSSGIGGDSITIIDATNVIINTILGLSSPLGLAYDSIHERIYVVNYGNDSVGVIDANSDILIDTISLGGGIGEPQYIAFNPSNGYMYISVGDTDLIVVIDTSNNTIIDNISITRPQYMAYSSATTNMYVALSGSSDSVAIIDTNNNVIQTIPVGNNPFSVMYNPNNQNIYVNNFSDQSISVIDSNDTLIATILNTGAFNYAVFANNNNNIYGTNDITDSVNVVIPALPIPSSPIKYSDLVNNTQTQPIKIETARILASSISVLNQAFNIQYLSAGGLVETKNIDISQDFPATQKIPIVELKELAGLIIDGNQTINATVPPGEFMYLEIIKASDLQELLLNKDFNITKYNTDLLNQSELLGEIESDKCGYRDKSLSGLREGIEKIKNRKIFKCQIKDKIGFLGKNLEKLKERVYGDRN